MGEPLLFPRQDWRGPEDQALKPVRQQAQLCVRAGLVEPVDDVLDNPAIRPGRYHQLLCCVVVRRRFAMYRRFFFSRHLRSVSIGPPHGVISHDTILSLCELLHIQPSPLVASGAGRRSVAVCVRSAPRPGAALLGQHARCVVSFPLRTSRTGGAYDSRHRTAGIAGRTRRHGGRVAARGARAAAGEAG